MLQPYTLRKTIFLLNTFRSQVEIDTGQLIGLIGINWYSLWTWQPNNTLHKIFPVLSVFMVTNYKYCVHVGFCHREHSIHVWKMTQQVKTSFRFWIVNFPSMDSSVNWLIIASLYITSPYFRLCVCERAAFIFTITRQHSINNWCCHLMVMTVPDGEKMSSRPNATVVLSWSHWPLDN